MVSFMNGTISVPCLGFFLFRGMDTWHLQIVLLYRSHYLPSFMIIHLLLDLAKKIPTGRARSPCVFALLHQSRIYSYMQGLLSHSVHM